MVTRKDERGRKTIYDLLPSWVLHDGWVPVGRLDRDSRGLLLLVNDSTLVERLGAPGAYEKMYEILVRGHVKEEHLQKMRTGIESPVGLLQCKEARIVGYIGPKTRLEIVLTEGKNRHIRRMLGALHDPVHRTPLKVVELKRVKFGALELDVPSGQHRFLTAAEEKQLLRNP